jgi:hypothetical protein
VFDRLYGKAKKREDSKRAKEKRPPAAKIPAFVDHNEESKEEDKENTTLFVSIKAKEPSAKDEEVAEIDDRLERL